MPLVSEMGNRSLGMGNRKIGICKNGAEGIPVEEPAEERGCTVQGMRGS